MNNLTILWMWLLQQITTAYGQAELSIDGSTTIAINERRVIVCTIHNGASPVWFVAIQNQTEQLFKPETSILAGDISLTNITSSSSTLILMTNRTDIVSISCSGTLDDGSSPRKRLNLTIYGIPDPPSNLYVSTIGNIVKTSWNYSFNSTVPVMFIITLTFVSPSQLRNLSDTVNNTNTHNFSLKGVRSCDPFNMCLTATNRAGSSNPLCVNNSLPYIPSTDNIIYLLLREEDSYSLNITIQMSECQEDNNLSYVALLQNQNDNQRLSPPAIFASPKSTIVITGLSTKSLYNLTIISNNSLGIGFSETQQLCTNDVQGVIICLTTMAGVFNVSCDYIIGCNYSGCSYKYTSRNTNINGSIVGQNYNNINIDVNTQFNLTVTDFNDEVVIIQKFNANTIPSCLITTETVPSDSSKTTTTDNNNVVMVVAVTISVLIFAIIVAVLVILLVVYLICNGYCGSCKLAIFQKSDTKKGYDLTIEYQGIGNPHAVVKTENRAEVNSKYIYIPEETTNDVMYDSLNTIKNQKQSKKPTEEDYSQIGTVPIYHVLEQNKPLATSTKETAATEHLPSEKIPEDDEAPPIPQYNPEGCTTPPILQNSDHHDSPSVQNTAVTNSSPADIMYAEVGTKSAAKT